MQNPARCQKFAMREPPKQLPHCEFLATRLFCADADGYASESLINTIFDAERRKERLMLII